MKGSDTMHVLAERWAEEYMKNYSNVSIYVEGGGTVVGIEALVNGNADLCLASRPLKSNEVQKLAAKYRKLGVATLVAKDALSVYVNSENPVQDLTLEQLKNIFTGELNNWQQVGGDNDSISVLIRSPNSGTFLYFQEHILGGDNYTTRASTLPSTQSIVRAVAESKNAIGYGGLAFHEGIVHCKIDGVEPTIANVQKGDYPIVRYLYLYSVDTPRGTIRQFVDWVLKDGQKVVRDVGYIPLWTQIE